MVEDKITDEDIRIVFKKEIKSGKYTVKQLRKMIEGIPWPTERWHLEYYRHPQY